ncbi:hypothetical protein AOQ84DRAFT_209719 [Glonium stellatum]|uniref:Uncharacterized protein n=1 Tax=Glonium stellatum TaxID=574774 RepID=A0A8E2F5L4_9PEZI|nr:hypothetical protein AOQ84DRAFT_209719 [Glonium stellatum]
MKKEKRLKNWHSGATSSYEGACFWDAGRVLLYKSQWRLGGLCVVMVGQGGGIQVSGRWMSNPMRVSEEGMKGFWFMRGLFGSEAVVGAPVMALMWWCQSVFA